MCFLDKRATQAVVYKGRTTYAYPAQMDTDVWYVQRPDGHYDPCTQSELRFVSKGHSAEHREMLIDPAATDFASLGESLEWPLVLIVATLVAVVWYVIAYGWLAALRPAVGVACIAIILIVARKS